MKNQTQSRTMSQSLAYLAFGIFKAILITIVSMAIVYLALELIIDPYQFASVGGFF